ncbi:hypothetical protein SAMN05216349_102147 [Oribacterium sp. KHPX15]|uniref:hypothetical protein n=1 Tax=Oribacterium sp. KHPX15 TaxID=1855342 RepID=UPI00089BCE4A|nr:hypothetical protein [Oribacterium sp. KHPX15]SDZ89148.1 hypothetical protein SAMN05216349_102147 [Oribacterium sp. KHPX15]
MIRKFRKTVYTGLILLSLITICSCGKRKTPQESVSSEDLTQEIISGIAEGFKSGEINVTEREKRILSNLVNYVMDNPEASMQLLSDAAKQAGFEGTFPEDISGVEPYYKAIAGTLLEADYITTDGNDIIIRKGTDSKTLSDLLSEAANDADTTSTTKTIDGKEVNLSLKDDVIYDAIWKEAGNAYSIYSENGIDEKTLKELIKQVK